MTAVRFPIVANPAAGGGRGKRRALEVEEAMRGAGMETEIHWTEGADHAEALAEELGKEAEVLVVCGGDGTIHRVVNGLDLSGTALAIAPSGRGDDLARVLGVPRDPGEFARMVAAGRRRRIDVGRSTGADGRRRRFCTVAALGFDAEVARRVVAGGPIGGPWVYVYGILRTLLSYRPRAVRLEGDFGVFEDEIFLAATANTSVYGGGLKIAPPASPDDGLLWVCLIRPVSRLAVLSVFLKVRSGGHVDHPAVSIRKSRSVRITSSSPMDLYADGEPLSTTPVTLDLLPRALDVLVP